MLIQSEHFDLGIRKYCSKIGIPTGVDRPDLMIGINEVINAFDRGPFKVMGL